MEVPVSVFFSYSHKDERLRDRLATHLSMLQNEKVIESWHDRKISAGTEWAQAIDDNLNSADIILLLISADFLASQYCYDIEMKQAIARHEAREARVIPIILRPVDWSGAPFGKLQAFPTNAKAVTAWSNQDKAFTNIAQGIRQAAKEMSEVLRDRPTPEPIPIPSPPEPPIGLENPEGSVSLDSSLYVDRPPIEATCYQEILKPGALIRIKAPRQMGKTSLMQRVLQEAQRHGQQTVYLNLQSADADVFNSIDLFLQWFCASVANELNLADRLSELWTGAAGSKIRCTNYFHRYLFPTLTQPLTLGLDEVDQVFHHLPVAQDFFGLLRSWHEKGKNDHTWQRFRLIIAHSREVYIPLNINHSPFNVGLPMELPELTRTQVGDLVQRHPLGWPAPRVEQMTDQLFGLVDGHPYLVRKALYEIARQNLTLEQWLAIAPTEAGLYGDHLRRHLENLQHDPPLAAAMKQVVRSDTPVRLESKLGFSLHSMGLVRRRGNDVEPLCNLYRLYFRDRLEGG